jgi:hypothetical protein
MGAEQQGRRFPSRVSVALMLAVTGIGIVPGARAAPARSLQPTVATEAASAQAGAVTRVDRGTQGNDVPVSAVLTMPQRSGQLLLDYRGSGTARTVRFHPLSAGVSASIPVTTVVTAGDGAAGDWFGGSVALSSDGSTALITGGGSHCIGAAYVFTRSGDKWTEQHELTASDRSFCGYFGWSVALSADGSTALIGSAEQNSTGAAEVFTRGESGWTQQAEVTAGDGAAGDFFGDSVALSGDGSTALIGDGDNHDRAYVITRSGGSWTQQAELTAGDRPFGAWFGESVALSADGSTALIGTFGSVDTAGAVYVFTRSGSNWTQQAELTAGDRAPSDVFGGSAALSADGSTALIGGAGKNSTGAVYMFTHSGSSWTQQAEFTAASKPSGAYFGAPVALSADGSAALIGALEIVDSTGADHTGAAYVFTRSGSSWTQQAEFTASDEAPGDFFARSLALSGDGSTALIGAPAKTVGKKSDQGAAYVAAVSAPGPTSASLAANLTETATPAAATAVAPAPSVRTSTAVATQTPAPLATGALQVDVMPALVRGGRNTTCGLWRTLHSPQAGCLVTSSLSGPRASVLYVLTFPNAAGVRQALAMPDLRETFRDTADSRGYSAHAFNVPYVPPMGAASGTAPTVVQVMVMATLADGRALTAVHTHFVVTR